eukprot:247049-Alexandrium_andersonii.AAC.1
MNTHSKHAWAQPAHPHTHMATEFLHRNEPPGRSTQACANTLMHVIIGACVSWCTCYCGHGAETSARVHTCSLQMLSMLPHA